jgi:hypothetical protein
MAKQGLVPRAGAGDGGRAASAVRSGGASEGRLTETEKYRLQWSLGLLGPAPAVRALAVLGAQGRGQAEAGADCGRLTWGGGSAAAGGVGIGQTWAGVGS